MSILDSRPELRREIEKVSEVAGYLWEKGWAERNGGNIVVNVTEYIDDELKSLPALFVWQSLSILLIRRK